MDRWRLKCDEQGAQRKGIGYASLECYLNFCGPVTTSKNNPNCVCIQSCDHLKWDWSKAY